ncbi:MAG: DUF433 domain-containing protein [Terriglobales bacterium]
MSKPKSRRISQDPAVCHGQPCIAGTRMPVALVLQMMANGDTIADLIEAYPTLSASDVRACLNYAAELVQNNAAPAPTRASSGVQTRPAPQRPPRAQSNRSAPRAFSARG